MLIKNKWIDLVIWIPKTNTGRSWDMQLVYTLKIVRAEPNKRFGTSDWKETWLQKRTVNRKKMKKILKLIQEGNPNGVWWKILVVSCQLWVKFCANVNTIGWLQKEKTLVDYEIHHRELKAICIENRRCITKRVKNKWVETRFNVCERTVRNHLNEKGFTQIKAKRISALHTNRRKWR